MKKILKIISITFLSIMVLLIIIPFAFQGQINDIIKRFINQNINAKVEFSNVSLSFISSFPQAQVNVNNLIITNFEPFKDEILVSAKSIAFTIPIKELFKKANEDPIIINSINLTEALLTLKTNKHGTNNYNISKPKKSHSNNNETNHFSFNLKDYNIKNCALTYIDEASKTTVHASELTHKGHGIFSADKSELNTFSEANISISIDSTTYLSNNPVKLNALIGLDLNNNIYTFKENKGFINDLPITFQGNIQLLKDGQKIDLSFKNPESDFKNFLAVIPKTYSKNIKNVKTTGDFTVNGIIKGMVTDSTIPTLNINITSNNASFKYPDLPKKVSNIFINTSIKNTTGKLNDTYIDIKTLNFKIDDDIFKSSISLKNITKNILVNANIDGKLNLSNLTKVYPIELKNTLSGVLKGNINTTFDMNALNTNAHQRIKNKGSIHISDFIFSSEDIINPIHISKAQLTFNPSTVTLNNFEAKTGNSDLNASGTIKNLLGFLLSDNTLKGHFNINSKLFKVSDFMNDDNPNNNTTTHSESLKIPKFLECTITANARTVVYDNLNLRDVKGILLIKNQEATLKDMTSNIFEGVLTVNGNVSTKHNTPTFNLNLKANNFDIAQSFKDLELLKNIAPIANLLTGKLNTNISLSGDLNNEFTPNLNSVSGKALAELLTTKIGTKQSKLINKIKDALTFINLEQFDLKDLKTKFNFSNGQVNVKPFDLTYEDISISISGSHNFDKTLKYNAVFNVPAKYLGSDINRLIGKIDTKEANNITIPVTANITGPLTNPIIQTDLTSGISNLTKQLIEIEKQKLLNQGKDQVKGLINNVIGGNKNKTDSLKKNQNNTVKNVLDGIISNNKTPTDSTKNTVKHVIGNLFGKKVKDTTK